MKGKMVVVEKQKMHHLLLFRSSDYLSRVMNLDGVQWEDYYLSIEYCITQIESSTLHPNENPLFDPNMINFNDERLYVFGGD